MTVARKPLRIAGPLTALVLLLAGAAYVFGPAGASSPGFGRKEGGASATSGNNSTASEVEISPDHQERTTTPGGNTTYNFTVTNHGHHRRSIVLQTDAFVLHGPSVGAWNHRLSTERLGLASGGSGRFTLTVSAPLATTQVSYAVRITAADASSGASLHDAVAVTKYLLP